MAEIPFSVKVWFVCFCIVIGICVWEAEYQAVKKVLPTAYAVGVFDIGKKT